MNRLHHCVHWAAKTLSALYLVAPLSAAGADAQQMTNGWSFAHWGMTRAEVRAVSGGHAHSEAGSVGADDDDTVDGGAVLGSYKLTVNLQYAGPADDNSRLVTILLQPPTADDKTCGALRTFMIKRLGPHHIDGVNGMYVTAEWKVGKNRITVQNMRGINCEIRIEPLEQDAS